MFFSYIVKLQNLNDALTIPSFSSIFFLQLGLGDWKNQSITAANHFKIINLRIIFSCHMDQVSATCYGQCYMQKIDMIER